MDNDAPEGRAARARRPIPPLDRAALERLALRYVERFSTTRARLVAYLRRKVRERGWEGAAGDPVALAEKFAELGYIDDRAYGEAKAGAMARRGLGKRRVGVAFRQAGIGEDDVAALAEGIERQAVEAALTFARKKRIGPFGTAPADKVLRERQTAAMIRGGHGFALSRRIATMAPGESTEDLAPE